MIKIAVDGRPLQGQLSGVGKYVLQIILIITRLRSDISFYIYTNRPLGVNFDSPSINVILDNKFKKVKPLIWSKFLLGRLLKKDVYHFTLFGGTFTALRRVSGKSIVVVHDLNHIYAKETMSKLHYLTHVLFFKKDVSNADYLISNSRGTATKLENNYNIKSQAILHPPIDNKYKILPPEDVASVLEKFAIKHPYILTVATQEPRKNLDKTIAAFTRLKDQGLLKAHKLVLVGAKGWIKETLRSAIDLNADIIKLGYVDENDLPYLYNGADTFVFPSKYEGYGMPATESILCGVKTVVSDIDELREATFGKAYYIDPNDVEGYANAIAAAIYTDKSTVLIDVKELQDNVELEIGNIVKYLSLAN